MGHYLNELKHPEVRVSNKNPPVYIGIDPGMSGGIAYLFDGKPHIDPMPETKSDILFLFRSLAKTYAESSKHAVIEQVTGYVGGPGNTGSSQFKFGRNVGWCELACLAAGIRMEEIPPNKWQRGLGIPPRSGKGKTKEKPYDYKRRLKGFAQQLFPGVEGITLRTCDALLLAEYSRRRREGEL